MSASASDKQTSAMLRDITGIMPARKAYWSADTSGKTLGIAATTADPTTAENGAGNLNGAYAWLVTQYDSLHDSEGNPNTTAPTRTVSNKTVRLTFADTASERATHRRIYRTTAGGTVYYRVGETAVANATYDDNTLDSALSIELEIDNDRPTSDARGLFVFGNRGFCFKTYNLYGSKASNLDQWPALNVLKIARGDPSDIKWAGPAGGDILIAKEQSLHLLAYDVDPFDAADGTVQPVEYGKGVLNEFCAVNAAGMVIGMDTNGIWGYSGARQTVWLDAGVRPLLRMRNMALRDWFSVVASETCVRFFFALLGDGATTSDPSTRWALVLDLRTLDSGAGPQWWLEYYDHKIRHAADFTFGSDTDEASGPDLRVPLATDARGRMIVLDMLTSDGLAGTLSGVVTVTGAAYSAPNTVISATGTYSVSAFSTYTCADLMVRFLTSTGLLSDPFPILSVGTNQFTVIGDASAWNGSTALIGGIQAEYRTPILDAGDGIERTMVEGLILHYKGVPDADGDVYAQTVIDERGAAGVGMTFTDGILAGTRYRESATFQIDGAPTTGAGRGVQMIAAGGSAMHSIQFILSVLHPNTPLSISRMAMLEEPPLDLEGG
jgi:hypothetical protein